MAVSYRECTVLSATIIGVQAVEISVEVVLSNGMPGFSIVGMTDVAIQEARERIRAALRGCGFSMPSEKITVNLAPGFLKKGGSGFDLPIAVGLLVASGQVSPQLIQGRMFVGELSLEGRVRAVLGMLAYQEFARANDVKLVCGHSEDFAFSGMDDCVLFADSLQALRSESFSRPIPCRDAERLGNSLDFADVGGHRQAKRALQIAAAGNHGLMMIGPPGSGKTMLASRLPSILPPLNEREVLETAKIYSIVGESAEDVLRGERPFRAHHHSASCAGLIGGGSPIKPGELSLAHNGVLFLDELAEFKPSVLQALRQPIEEGSIVLVRADGKVKLPSRFMLVAASNPCPCGYFGDSSGKCSCSHMQVVNYQNRIGGPLIDRIDMCVDVWRSDFKSVIGQDSGPSSRELREGVLAAREFAFQRWRKSGGCSQDGSTRELAKACMLDCDSQLFLEDMAQVHSMSGRGIASVLRVSRTIADIEQSECVLREHLAEALTLRLRTGR